jgi:glutamyl-tRNA synthetase
LPCRAIRRFSKADGTEREVFTFEEFTERFDWAKVNPAGSIFNLDKLDWLNGHYIRSLPLGEFASRLLPFLEADGVLSDNPSPWGSWPGSSGSRR